MRPSLRPNPQQPCCKELLFRLTATRETVQHQHELKDDQNPYDVENRRSVERDQDYEPNMTDDLNNDRATEAIETEEMEFSLS